MIAHLNGEIAEKFEPNLIIDVNGVGYEVAVTRLDYETCLVGETRKFYTYHQIAENLEKLYGFSSLAAKKLFELLITVQGVGPKAAMAILSLSTPEEVRNAIANDDVKFISKAVGVGKKSAERVIVDLREKVGAPSRIGATEPMLDFGEAKVEEQDDALDALIALGFPLKEATAALEKVDRGLPVEERIRLALRK